jgi:hypothetical protein
MRIWRTMVLVERFVRLVQLRGKYMLRKALINLQSANEHRHTSLQAANKLITNGHADVDAAPKQQVVDLMDL